MSEQIVAVKAAPTVRVIRQARIADLERLLELGEMFYIEAGLPGKFDPVSFAGNWTFFINGNMGTIFLLEEDSLIIAAIGGLRFPEAASGRVQGQEMFWYVHPDHRRSGAGEILIVEFERWAKDTACQSVILALLQSSPKGVEELYLRRGYVPLETWYTKEI